MAPHSSTELLEVITGKVVRRPAVHDLRDQDAPGRLLLRLRGLRQHQRLQLTDHNHTGARPQHEAGLRGVELPAAA